MIRIATRDDVNLVVQLLQQFLQETAYSQAEEASSNYRHLASLVWATISNGRIWISQRGTDTTGLLMAISQPNMWAPGIRELRELVFYVVPSARGGTTAGRLFKAFEKYADELLAQGKIEFYFTTRMSTTTNYDLTARGFRLVETTYVKE
jgi:N-acetylglutamate synthase-like GNAT family acetyltransferase